MKQITEKTVLMKYIEMQHGVPLEELLRSMYIDKSMSIRDIGTELNVHYHTINKWLHLFGIDVRIPYEKLLEVMEIRRNLLREEEKSRDEENVE